MALEGRSSPEERIHDEDEDHLWMNVAPPSSANRLLDQDDVNYLNHSHSVASGNESVSVVSHGEGSNSTRVGSGNEPPPYSVYDPAKDNLESHEFELDSEDDHELYTPLYLRAWMFVLFAFAFSGMLIALELLYQASLREQGLSTQRADRHYLWTLGPTMFLTLVAAFWGQVEYRVKQLMPWKSITKGPVPAEKVLLTDYVSPWNVSALITSLKAKHIVVTLSIAGSLLLKLAIIFSAAFLSLNNKRVYDDGADLVIQDSFVGFGTSGNHSDIQPVITVVGIAQFGLAYPEGTSEIFAVQSFRPTTMMYDSSTLLITGVDAFSANWTCEAATVTHVSDSQCADASSGSGSDCGTVYYNLTVSSDSCTTNTTQIHVSPEDSVNQFYGSVTPGECLDQSGYSFVDSVRYAVVFGHEYISYNDGAANATNSTALICQPVYALCEVPVELYMNGSINMVGPNKDNQSCSELGDISAWDIAESVLNSIVDASVSLTEFGYTGAQVNGSSVHLDSFFQTLNATAMPRELANLTNATYLQTTSEQLFTRVAAQVAKRSLMESVNDPCEGTLVTLEQRLIVNTVSLRVLEAIFALLIAIALITALLRPSSSTPCDVAILSGLACVLARSPSTKRALQGLGSTSRNEIKRRLAGYSCESLINDETNQATFRLITTSKEQPTRDSTDQLTELQTITWWRPLTMNVYVRVALTVLPLALIATLEAVYQRSVKDRGLADVQQTASNRYVWIFIPVWFMLIVQIPFQMIDKSTRIIQPFANLREGHASADKSIDLNYLSTITVRCFWKALRRRDYAVALTSLAMLLAPLLAVVASALYYPAAVSQLIDAKVTLSDSISNSEAWNSTANFQNGADSTLATLIVEGNMSFPSWTYSGYVFPKINTDLWFESQPYSNATANTTSLSVVMPAVYAAMNCTLVQPNVTLSENVTSSVGLLSVPVPLGCGDECLNSDYNETHYCNSSESSYLHFQQGLELRSGLSNYGEVYIPGPDYVKEQQNCPQIALAYGQAIVDGQNSVVALNMTAALCLPVVYSISVNTTFLLDDFTILDITPQLETRQAIARGGPGNATRNIRSTFPPTNWGVESFYGGLVPGRNGTEWGELIGEENWPHMAGALDELYSIIYTQWLNLYGRVEYNSTTATTNATLLNATIWNPQRMRLMQSPISTRILEGLLAMMALCTFASIFLLKEAQSLLPSDPCSVAASASLLAESEILASIPEGAQWCHSAKQRTKKRVFEAHLFSLGWFEGVGGRRRFAVDTGEAEKGA